MEFELLIKEATQTLPVIGETHWLKTILSLKRFHVRYPHWSDETLSQILRHSTFYEHPKINDHIFTHIDNLHKSYTKKAAIVYIARGMFPLAYIATKHWLQESSLDEIVMSLKERALHEGTYLGHGWTVWCSFNELLQEELGQETIWFAMERFVEFSAKTFPGYPTSNPHWHPPKQSDPGETNLSMLIDDCLEHPGFFGHHLLTLGYLYRHRDILSDLEWKIGLHQVKQMAKTLYTDDEDNVQIQYTDDLLDSKESDFENVLLGFLLHGPENPHTITLSDIACDLWEIFNSVQRSKLLYYLRTFYHDKVENQHINL